MTSRIRDHDLKRDAWGEKLTGVIARGHRRPTVSPSGGRIRVYEDGERRVRRDSADVVGFVDVSGWNAINIRRSGAQVNASPRKSRRI